MFKLEFMKSEKIMDARSRFNYSFCVFFISFLVFCMLRYEEEEIEWRLGFYFRLKNISFCEC